MRPSGAGSITMTNPNYQVYNGVDITVTKRYSDKWQLTGAVTIQDNPQLLPGGFVDRSRIRPASSTRTVSARSPST